MSSTVTIPAGPHIRTTLPGPNARRILEGDKTYISPSYTRSYPLVAKRGRGVVVEDVDGNEFLDFSAGIAVVSTGHCHPEVVAAIQQQAAELIHMSGTDFYYEHMITLAERLSAVAPMKGPHRFYYGNSGAEAIEAAIKLARYHTKRQNIIAFYGAFHGRTMGALSLTSSKVQQRRRFFPLMPGVTHVPYPNVYRRPQGTDPVEYAVECARFIEQKLLKTTLPPEEVAAIFVEPIQGEGGYVVAPPEFLMELRRICDRHGILLVADEVQCGSGRSGKWWAIQHAGVEPDIVCIAKGIASGMPLSVMMTRQDIMDWVPGSHASTFGGNPVCIAAALATINVLEREGDRQRRYHWPPHHAAHQRVAEEVRHGGRRARTRLDDRRRTGHRQAKQSARRSGSRQGRRTGLRARLPVPRRRRELRAHLPAADHHAGTGRYRARHPGRVHPHRGQKWRPTRQSVRK